MRQAALEDEWRGAHRDVEATQDLVQPTAEEARNGWTAETLTAYLAEQQTSQSLRADPVSLARRVKPVRANSRYNPLRWRG